MNLDTKMIVSISEANKDFSRVIHLAESYGRVVLLRDNKPKYLLIDLEQEALIFDLTEEEKLGIATKRNDTESFIVQFTHFILLLFI